MVDGRYRVGQRLGSGGMGDVYAAELVNLRKQVAIKFLRLESLHTPDGPSIIERFLREARAASAIKHHNVVDIIDYGESEGKVYYVMERLYGRDLAAVLRSVERLSWSETRGILLQTARALRAAHDHGIIHRDIKPGNIFIVDREDDDDEQRVKVLDFGIAKVEPSASIENQALTKTSQILGTAWYMAPEQATGGTANPRSDVYALGVVAYQMLTGLVPFDGPTTFQVLYRHLQEPPKPLRELAPDVQEDVERLVLRALAKDPEARFTSMRAMGRAIAAIGTAGHTSVLASHSQETATSTQTPTDAPTEPVAPIARRTGGSRRVLVGITATASLGALAWALTRQPTSPASKGSDHAGSGAAAAAAAAPPVPADPDAIPAVDPGGPERDRNGDGAPAHGRTPEAPAAAQQDPTAPESVSGARTAPEPLSGAGTAPTIPAGPGEGAEGHLGTAKEEGGPVAASDPPSAEPRTTEPQVKRRRPPATDAETASRLRQAARRKCSGASVPKGTSIQVTFSIGSDGVVGAPRIHGDTFGTEVAACLERLVEQTTFPKGALRVETITFTF